MWRRGVGAIPEAEHTNGAEEIRQDVEVHPAQVGVDRRQGAGRAGIEGLGRAARGWQAGAGRERGRLAVHRSVQNGTVWGKVLPMILPQGTNT